MMKIKHSSTASNNKRSKLSEQVALERQVERNVERISKEAVREHGGDPKKRKKLTKKVNFI